MLLRCKAETARGSEIERARVAGNLSDHAGKVAAFQPLLEREQRILGSRRLDMDEPVAQVGREAVVVGSSAKLHCAFVLHPQNLAAILCLGEWVILLRCHGESIAGKGERQAGATGVLGTGEDFAVQRAVGEARPPARLARFRQGIDILN